MKRTRLEIYDDYPNSAIDDAINEWVHNDRDRRILHHKLIDGWSFEKIAEDEDMSSKRIQNIVYKAGDKLSKHLEIIYKR